MAGTPLAEKIRIVLYGLRNSGKSSLMNNLFEKEISIVSDTPGTTTDPVTRSIELDTLGPTAITDVPGFDDVGELGTLRIKKAAKRMETADIIIVVSRHHTAPTPEEQAFIKKLAEKKKNFVIALTFGDMEGNKEKLSMTEPYSTIVIDNLQKTGITQLKKRLIALKDHIEYEITPVEGLVKEHDFVILVTPIDLAAPKSRLILPQVETIRDLLDKDCGTLIVKERELKYFYDGLGIKPKLVITDSQAFSKVAADIPEDQPLTSFSILFARKKGDLSFFVDGVKKLENVPKNAKILILESCSHHRKPDDIGTVKIPRLFKQLVQSKVEFEFAKELPDSEQLKSYYLVINCAGCMVTRNVMIKRIQTMKEHNIHGINYGLFLAWVNGLLPRALQPFTLEYEQYMKS